MRTMLAATHPKSPEQRPKCHEKNPKILPKSRRVKPLAGIGPVTYSFAALAWGLKMTAVASTTIRVNGRDADLARGTVSGGRNATVALRPQSLAILKLLVIKPGVLVSKDEIMSAVWPNIAVTDDSLVQCVTEIRKALGDDRHAIIKTVPKRGYVFEPGAHEDASTGTRSWTMIAVAAAVALAIGAGLLWFNRPLLGSVQRQSIAVLPFENLSDDPQQVFFADGIAEDLLTDISRLSGVFVIARNSSFAYRGKAADARVVARDLGVRYVLEGSVRRADGQVRINVQLIDGATGSQQWAERYDGVYADIFALQDRVTKAVVSALAVQLTSDEQMALGRHDTAVPAAYEAFLRGWEHYQKTTPEDYKKAIPYFERATELDPDYGRAHAALAMVYFRSYDQKWTASLGISTDRAFRTAQRYLKLAMARPTSTSHQVAGNISRERGWYDDALREFAAAIALDPSDSWSYADQAYALIWAGRPAEAEIQIAKAMQLDPRYPGVFVYYNGLALFAQDRLPEAIRTFDEALQLNPDLPLLRLYLASAQALSGKLEEAKAMVAAFSEARVRAGGLPFVMVLLRGDDQEILFKVPERSRLLQGLHKLNIPYDFKDKAFDGQRLTGAEIDALVFGHRIHGWSEYGASEHGAFISADGSSALAFGDWSVGSGSAHVKDDRLCLVWATTSFCSAILRNSGGTKAKENEYILLLDSWNYPFSRVD
jgi:adenylate cyclase